MAGFSNPGNNPFKDHKGQWLTLALFFETRGAVTEIPPKYTLKDDDHKGLPSLKRLYLETNHVPEYEYDFATEHLGGWKHWKRLQASPILREHINEWKEELTIKIKASAMRNIIASAYAEGAVGLQASKYLSDQGYKGTGRGRPSKEEKMALAKQEARVDLELEEDLKRIGLKAVK